MEISGSAVQQNGEQLLRRMDQNRSAGVDELRLIPEAPGDRDAVHAGVTGGPEVDFGVADIDIDSLFVTKK